MKNLQLNLYQYGAGRVGSKKSKSIPAPPRGARLKSCPILAPPPLRGRENPRGAKRGRAGQNCHPYSRWWFLSVSHFLTMVVLATHNGGSWVVFQIRFIGFGL